MNYSKKREMILLALRQTDSHPTVEAVYSVLKPDYPKLSLATVYRNLNQLCEAGLVKRLVFPNSPDRFDGSMSPHYHFYCNECGGVHDIERPAGGSGIMLPADLPHTISSCDVVFCGSCSNCVNADKIIK